MLLQLLHLFLHIDSAAVEEGLHLPQAAVHHFLFLGEATEDLSALTTELAFLNMVLVNQVLHRPNQILAVDKALLVRFFGDCE